MPPIGRSSAARRPWDAQRCSEGAHTSARRVSGADATLTRAVHPWLSSSRSERLGDLLYRLKHSAPLAPSRTLFPCAEADPLSRSDPLESPPLLDTLDIAAHLLPRRGSPDRVAFTGTLFSEFRPEIAIKAATKMEQGKGAAWDAVRASLASCVA